jgi:hypothetical protein
MNDDLIKMCEDNGVSLDVGMHFLESLNQHIAYVQEQGRRMGISEIQILGHDLSKFSAQEIPFYARNFFGGKSPVDQPHSDVEFACAWLHHQNHNPHHWEYWVSRSGKYKNQALPMPEKYIKEMIADWHGASKAYTGDWDISEWLNKNGPNMILHISTIGKISEIMIEIGYDAGESVWSFE